LPTVLSQYIYIYTYYLFVETITIVIIIIVIYIYNIYISILHVFIYIHGLVVTISTSRWTGPDWDLPGKTTRFLAIPIGKRGEPRDRMGYTLW
jgi:hypothetical protein